MARSISLGEQSILNSCLDIFGTFFSSKVPSLGPDNGEYSLVVNDVQHFYWKIHHSPPSHFYQRKIRILKSLPLPARWLSYIGSPAAPFLLFVSYIFEHSLPPASFPPHRHCRGKKANSIPIQARLFTRLRTSKTSPVPIANLSQTVEVTQRSQSQSGSKDDFIKRCKDFLNISHPQGDSILILGVLDILETTVI
jgi:hypothetical protein